MQYELRTYLIPTSRMEDNLARFRTVTKGLFEKYNMECLGFRRLWQTQLLLEHPFISFMQIVCR